MNSQERIKALREKNDKLSSAMQDNAAQMRKIGESYDKVSEIAGRANIIIDDLDKQFDEATKLQKTDQIFLFTATALQCIRQYVIGKKTQRKNHDVSDEGAHDIQQKIFGKNKNDPELGVRYRASKDEIMHTFNVPYDVTKGTKKYGVGGKDGKDNSGLSGNTHRFKTLGHDPLFGWVFGTANIMTNTLTNNKLETFHVKNSAITGRGRTTTMMEHFKQRSSEHMEDLGICLIKQGLHIGSDMFSKKGIALPGMVRLDAETAQKLAEYGIDFGNVVKVGTQASMAILINQIIAMIHRLLYDESVEFSRNNYEVRTRKILLYSNCLASSSNVIATALGTTAGVITQNNELTKKSLNYLDIGGAIETIHQIASDGQFISQIKEEFMRQQWYEYVSGELNK